MRTRQRLLGLKHWAERELCEGRIMKAPPADGNIGEIVRTEPKVFLAWQPQRNDTSEYAPVQPVNVVPSITIMPTQSLAKFVEEKRFDRYANIRRQQEMGQSLCVQMLFSVYEPGTRLPGFVESVESGRLDMSLLEEGTEEGLFALTDWMDEAREKLISGLSIPDTDLFLEVEKTTYSLYMDENYVVDKRPLFYGFITAEFKCYADDGNNSELNKLLL